MKMSNPQKMKVLVILLLSLIIGTFTHCMPQNSIQVGESGSEKSSYSHKPPKDEGQILKATEVTTGVKNHEQILHTMAAVTGIDPYGTTNNQSNASILTVYREVEMSLPTNNDVKVFSTTQQVAVTKLAAEFCDKLVRNEYAAVRTQIWPRLQFTAVPNTAFNAVNSVNFINDTIDSLWSGMLSDEERALAHAEFEDLIDILVGNDNNAAATSRAVRGVCISALSSAYITLL